MNWKNRLADALDKISSECSFAFLLLVICDRDLRTPFQPQNHARGWNFLFPFSTSSLILYIP